MTSLSIAHYRLACQHIAHATFEQPGELVGWLGAVQAQDYLGALWAVGLRMQAATETRIEQALTDRSIVRTWPMRGTLHFVAAADAAWMLDLLAPRVIARAARRYRQLGLDDAAFERSRALFVDALQGDKQLTRHALMQLLEVARISTAGQRGIHILGRLAQEGLVCLGARAGKQQTFALLSEWVPQARTLTRPEGLAELSRRYFTSHGPATLQDFVWWSGLSTSDARTGLEMAMPQLAQETIDGRAYWVSTSASQSQTPSPTAYLLPAFDEYLVGYRDRSAVLDPTHVKQTNAGGGMLSPTLVVDGQIAGTWKRTLKKSAVVIMLSLFRQLTKAEGQAAATAAGQYGAFLELPVELLGM